ncbi:30S ribosomal protein S8 [Candidatus Woesebacteria bacterium]|nr:30S ribosomal protein S8 [Candidatus Woesebacteria bacterium]
MTDPISNFITSIKNGLMAHKETVVAPYSKLKEAVAAILVREGYITSVTVDESGTFKKLVVTLKYVGKLPAVTQVKRLSKPGIRLYAPATQIPKALGGYGITIISTNKGIVTDKEARKLNLGGELLCQIW